MNNKPVRHGDVLLIPVSRLPANAKKTNGLTLAEGELTGHSHQITSGKALIYESEGKRFLEVTKVALLSHEEHHALSVPIGVYEIGIQREFVPEGWIYVAD